MNDWRSILTIAAERLEEVNRTIADADNPAVAALLEVVERYGGPEAINARAKEAGSFETLMARLKEQKSPYVADVEWLGEQREKGAFTSFAEWKVRVLGEKAAHTQLDRKNAVTLEISALQFFPWLITEARRAIAKRELMPGRFIRVRCMAEQAADQGDLFATAAAVQTVGASLVETLDTRGTDGSNVHLNGPETITGYFGGVGQPNHYPVKWADELLHYYTTSGVKQVLNVNAGTIFAAYLLYKLGIDIAFKISVYMGNDNPFAVFWTLMAARLFARPDGTTPLVGFNFSNSVNNDTIRQAAWLRNALGLENVVRFEHHITETYKSIVRQPYNRRAELVEVAREVGNISAKHEGGEPEIETTLHHPSDILDYFTPKAKILELGLWEAMERNYIEKHHSLNLTAEALVKAGIGVVAAQHLHK
ncbi:MAG: hypothetical protein C4523_08035 [Myxococcales bacterium]|nr:MAG: hypothetical protein C4523_08035 [Myxococcales bacterium]